MWYENGVGGETRQYESGFSETWRDAGEFGTKIVWIQRPRNNGFDRQRKRTSHSVGAMVQGKEICT